MERTGTSRSCPSRARARQVAGLHAVGQPDAAVRPGRCARDRRRCELDDRVRADAARHCQVIRPRRGCRAACRGGAPCRCAGFAPRSAGLPCYREGGLVALARGGRSDRRRRRLPSELVMLIEGLALLSAEQAAVVYSGSNVLVRLNPAPAVARVMTGTVALHEDPAAVAGAGGIGAELPGADGTCSRAKLADRSRTIRACRLVDDLLGVARAPTADRAPYRCRTPRRRAAGSAPSVGWLWGRARGSR